METNIKEIDQHGLVLAVDTDFRTIYHPEHPKVGLEMMNLGRSGNGYEFFMDTRDTILLAEANENCIRFEIDQLVTLNPEGMAMAYGLRSLRDLPENDADLLSLNQAYERRSREDILPGFRIGNRRYQVDLLRSKLVPVDKATGVLPFSSFERLPDGRMFGVWDHRARNLADWRMHGDRPLPAHYSAVLLPSPMILDPVGEARRMGMRYMDFTWLAPVRNDLQARFFPLSLLGLKQEAAAPGIRAVPLPRELPRKRVAHRNGIGR